MKTIKVVIQAGHYEDSKGLKSIIDRTLFTCTITRQVCFVKLLRVVQVSSRLLLLLVVTVYRISVKIEPCH